MFVFLIWSLLLTSIFSSASFADLDAPIRRIPIQGGEYFSLHPDDLQAVWYDARVVPGRDPGAFRIDSRGYVIISPKLSKKQSNLGFIALHMDDGDMLAVQQEYYGHGHPANHQTGLKYDPHDMQQAILLDMLEIALLGFLTDLNGSAVCWTPSEIHQSLFDLQPRALEWHRNMFDWNSSKYGMQGHNAVFQPMGVYLKRPDPLLDEQTLQYYDAHEELMGFTWNVLPECSEVLMPFEGYIDEESIREEIESNWGFPVVAPLWTDWELQQQQDANQKKAKQATSMLKGMLSVGKVEEFPALGSGGRTGYGIRMHSDWRSLLLSKIHFVRDSPTLGSSCTDSMGDSMGDSSPAKTFTGNQWSQIAAKPKSLSVSVEDFIQEDSPVEKQQALLSNWLQSIKTEQKQREEFPALGNSQVKTEPITINWRRIVTIAPKQRETSEVVHVQDSDDTKPFVSSLAIDVDPFPVLPNYQSSHPASFPMTTDWIQKISRPLVDEETGIGAINSPINQELTNKIQPTKVKEEFPSLGGSYAKIPSEVVSNWRPTIVAKIEGSSITKPPAKQCPIPVKKITEEFPGLGEAASHKPLVIVPNWKRAIHSPSLSASTSYPYPVAKGKTATPTKVPDSNDFDQFPSLSDMKNKK